MAKKKNNFLLIGLILILVLAIGFSYGYYLLNKVQENNNIVGSKCFNLEFTNEKNAINLDNMYPISDEEGRKLTPYSFTITNTCDMLAGYTVNMEMLEGTTLNSKYLDVMVNNEQIKLLTNYESTNTVITGSTESRILAKGTLAYNDSIDYTVRFWMDKDVEDMESMNKLFKSKMVISATPSSWNPKDAGYDTLHDAILANEYQTTPEMAKEKIAAKQEVDLSQTAPIIKWVEKTGESTTKEIAKPDESVIEVYNKDTGTGDRTTQASNLTLNDTKLKLYKSYTFNDETGKYTLDDSIYVDPTTLDFSDSQKYYYQSEYINHDKSNDKLYTVSGSESNTVNLVTGASKSISTSIWNGIEYNSVVYNLSLIKLTETELEADKSDNGLYQAIDDYGTTYYYRGNVKNNNVYFAGFYWRIVRINGNGTIRLLYNGVEKNAIGIKQMINNTTVDFNSRYNSPAYVGYMYGNPDGTTFDEVHANINDSTIKVMVDQWYKSNIEDKGYNSILSRSVGFCDDRSLYGGDGIRTDKMTYFGAYGRYAKKTATFVCQNQYRDLYTTKDSSFGNKALTYPIGLITYDELAYAGMDNGHTNKLSWVYSTQHYWTMSSSRFDASWGYANVWSNYNVGYLYPWSDVTNRFGARPVINLNSDVKLTGGIGTSNDPYVIDTNN